MKSPWPTRRLDELADVGAGNPAPQGDVNFLNGTVPFFRTSDVGRVHLGELHDAEGRLNKEGARGMRLHPAGTVLLPKSGASTFTDHRVITTTAGYVSSHLATVKASKTAIDRYLYYVLQTVSARDVAGDSSYPTLSLAQIKAIEVPAPPVPEQQRIVAVLDEAYEAIEVAVASAQATVAQIAYASEALISKFVFKEGGLEWNAVRVGDLAQDAKGAVRTGPFGSQLLHSEFVESGIAVLGIDNVVTNEFRWSKRRYISKEKYAELRRYTVSPGDVLISIMGTCGRCAIVPDDIPVAINSKHLCCISLDQEKCLPEYLWLYFLHHAKAQEYLREQAKGSIMAGLNMGIIKDLPIVLPDLNEQRAIVARYRNLIALMDALLKAKTRKIGLLGELKHTLLARALAGELTREPLAA